MSSIKTLISINKRSMAAALGLALLLAPRGAAAQPRTPANAGHSDDPAAGTVLPRPDAAPEGSTPLAVDWQRADRVLRVPGAGEVSAAEASASAEIFPDADKVYLQVIGTDATPIEAARRGAKRWICSSGCTLSMPQDGAPETVANEILQSIKLQTPTNPLPLTLWHPTSDAGQPGSLGGKLLFDPRLMGRRDYQDRCAFAPVTQRARVGDPVGDCWTERRLVPRHGSSIPTADTAEMFLGLRMPAATTNARFQYVAVTDTCGNAQVYPFQHTLSVPVYLVASGGCGSPDGRVLRVFPSGGWMRVTPFNLDAPAAGSVASVTYRVSVPPLEDLVNPEPPPLLFPEVRPDELVIDCSPQLLKARTGPGGVPRTPPGKGEAVAPPGKPPRGPAKKGAPTAPPATPTQTVPPPPSDPSRPLAHESLVIAPEPILNGNCRIEYRSQSKRRLVAPLALRVRIARTDKLPGDRPLLEADWVITPTNATFRIPKLGVDGESRLLLEVSSNPTSPLGNVVLLGDAGRYQRRASNGGVPEASLQRLLGSATIHTAPLCGGSNFELADKAGRCVRGYFTVPAMLATLQVTRAPWVERPLITRTVLSAVGLAFALDGYDPVERRALPVAFQVGGFVQDLGDERLGLTSYVGVAPTVPVLGTGGNTTNIGLVGGLGMTYVTRASGTDEGFKPTAFLSIVVQVGQINPSLQDGPRQTFGTYSTVVPGVSPSGGADY
ncbi:MAG: hypothetical protein FJ096_08895 [Deltaproteobacteria bacterium]|nr:hypothetical protein [Deltaproteobacteria bacterium]